MEAEKEGAVCPEGIVMGERDTSEEEEEDILVSYCTSEPQKKMQEERIGSN